MIIEVTDNSIKIIDSDEFNGWLVSKFEKEDIIKILHRIIGNIWFNYESVEVVNVSGS